jgi:hypothetical protein
MPYTTDIFDDVVQADVDEVAPGMVEAIGTSLGRQFDVGDVTVRTVLIADGGFSTVRWSVDCVDSIVEDRRRTNRSLTVHGMSLVSGRSAEQVVTHYIDWAGAMAQLGMTTSRPSAVDPPSLS